MSRWSPHQFEQAASGQLDPASINAAVKAAHATQDLGLPAILTLKHLSVHVGLGYKYVRRIAERQYDPYRTFHLKKRSGGYRVICVPERDLMYLQRWILRYVLSSARIHSCSYAYQSAKSISDCASAHLGAEWLVKVDIRQFFESISEIQVFRIFESLGYGKLISMEMARLTTRLVPARSSRAKEPNWQAWQTQRYNIACYKTVLQGALPQGAPTSPMLSNIAMYGFDVDVAREADALGWAYTRYSDDLIFSTRRAGTTRSDAEELIKLAYRKMNATGLRPHQAKSVIAPPGARKVVLGLLVDGNQLRLRKDFRKSLECHVHYIKTLGPVKHAERRGFRSISGMKAYVFGLIAFAESIDKDFALRIRQSLCNVSWPT